MTCELIQPLDMGAWAETKVVRAGELRYGDASGWIIVGQFKQTVVEFDGYGRERVKIGESEELHFLLGRKESNALAAAEKKINEAVQKQLAAESARQKLETELRSLQESVTSGNAAKTALEQERSRANKMEADIATLAKELGHERMRSILDREIPF